MRSTRSIAAALTLAALAVPGSALAGTSAGTTQAATANVPATLTASFPTDPISLTLAPGTNESSQQAVNVKSNLAWGLRVTVDNAALTNSDTSATLANPLQVSVVGSGVFATVPQTAATNLVEKATDAEAQAAGDAGTSKNLVFEQTFSYADAPGDYQSTITYAADQAF